MTEQQQRIILDSRWYSTREACIGIVAARTGMHEPQAGEWKAYIGVCSGLDRKQDEQHAADYGTGLQPEEAHGFFPHLDITRYKQE